MSCCTFFSVVLPVKNASGVITNTFKFINLLSEEEKELDVFRLISCVHDYITYRIKGEAISYASIINFYSDDELVLLHKWLNYLWENNILWKFEWACGFIQYEQDDCATIFQINPREIVTTSAKSKHHHRLPLNPKIFAFGEDLWI